VFSRENLDMPKTALIFEKKLQTFWGPLIVWIW